MQVLLIEDDPFIAKAIVQALQAEQYSVQYCASGTEGLLAFQTGNPDIVLLDLGLPGMDGIDVLQSIRASHVRSDVPILILSARDALESRLEGLDLGADDYLIKPFHMARLFARIRAVLRRKGVLKSESLRAGNVRLNTVTHLCTVGDQTVTLSKREYALLAALLVRPGAILSKRALEEKLYAPNEQPESNAIEYLIHALRKKIGAHAIENIRGLGWRMKK